MHIKAKQDTSSKLNWLSSQRQFFFIFTKTKILSADEDADRGQILYIVGSHCGKHYGDILTVRGVEKPSRVVNIW